MVWTSEQRSRKEVRKFGRIDKLACRSTGSDSRIGREIGNNQITQEIGKEGTAEKERFLKPLRVGGREARRQSAKKFSVVAEELSVAFLILGFATAPPRQFHSLSRREKGREGGRDLL